MFGHRCETAVPLGLGCQGGGQHMELDPGAPREGGDPALLHPDRIPQTACKANRDRLGFNALSVTPDPGRVASEGRRGAASMRTNYFATP